MSPLPFSKIIVVVPWFAEHDAISNDASWQCQLLKATGNEVFLYAEGASPSLIDKLISWQQVQDLVTDQNALLIYHHGVYWLQGEQLIQKAKCKIVLKYHNITPPDFYRNYDRPSTFATERGRDQTARFLASGKFTCVLSDSHYNIEDLRSYELPLPKSAVAAPFTQVQDFDGVEDDPQIVELLEKDEGYVHILFVGRVVPNKGHLHLIEVLNRYIELFGSKVKLHVVGAIAMSEDTYFKELELAVNSRKLSQHVNFHQKIGLRGIKALYRKCDVFLLMSEHEGFCVPILEAQYLGLPLVALAKAAVPETLGPDQLIFADADYDIFAAAIARVSKDKVLREELVRQGHVNRLRFSSDMIMNHTIELLNNLN